MLKKIIYIIFIIFLGCSLYAETSIKLSLSPEKTQYFVNDDISLLFSCTTNENNLIGDVYIAFYTPQKMFFSITPYGIKQGIQPYVTNIKMVNVNNFKVFSFKYYNIFESGGYKILSAIVKSNTTDIVSNIASVEIPGKENNNDNETIQESNQINYPIWNSIKSIWENTPYYVVSAKPGGNYIHALLKRSSNKYYYLRLDLNGHIIIPPYELPFTGEMYHSPSISADENDNVYIIFSDKNFYLLKINSNGVVEFNKVFYTWKSSSSRPEYLSSFVKNGKIYFVGRLPYLQVVDNVDSNKKTYYRYSVLLGIVDTNGELQLSPSPISGEVKEFYKSDLQHKTDDIKTTYPEIVVDNNDVAHIFWDEIDHDLKTGYYVKYLRYDPKALSSQIVTVGEMGNDAYKLSAYIDNSTIYLGYLDYTHSPRQIKLLKISTNGNLLKESAVIPTESPGATKFFIGKDKFRNINLYYYNSSKHKISRVVVDDDLIKIKKENEILFSNTSFHSYYSVCIDKNKNFHLLASSYGSPYKLYYSNTESDNSSFKNLPDILISPANFKCSPSNNVDIGSSITCSFDVFNVSNSQISNGDVSVNINEKNIFSSTFSSIEAYSFKTFSFQYSPQDANTPEYPSTEVKASITGDELTQINNSISPEIRVRPVPQDTDIKLVVYDESYDPEHSYVLPIIKDAICSIYDSNGQLVATALLNQFKNIPIGDSNQNAKDYTIKCEKQGYNPTEEDISIWRDSNDPYKVDFSVNSPVRIYLNNWGKISLELSYYDDKGNEKSLSGATVYIENDKYSKIVKMDTSSEIINNIPAGKYNIKIEKENYERKEFEADVNAGEVFSKDVITSPTTTGDILINITGDTGYIPVKATVKIKKSGNIVKTITVNNGYYKGELEKGYYTFTFEATDFDKEDVNSSIKAGISNEINVTLSAATPSNLKAYSRSEEAGIVAYTKIAEWPSTPLTDGFKVETVYGLFTVRASFIGEESDNEIYNIKQLVLHVNGGPAIKYSVSSTWDPTEIIDLPELASQIYDLYSALPMAITPEIPINMTGYIGKSKIRIDKIVVKDDLANIFYQSKPSFYSDGIKIIQLNKILDKNSQKIIAEIYLKVGKEGANDSFEDSDVLDGLNCQYLKLTYTVPKEKPEYGWYFHNVITGSDTHITSSSVGQSIVPSNMLILKYKPFKPYKINIEYVNPSDYVKNILGIPQD